MIIESIETFGYRNLKAGKIDTNSKHIILTGNNGQGKTNLLEAVYLICFGASFRTSSLREIIQHSEDSFFVKSIIKDRDGFKHTIRLVYSRGKRVIYLDEKEIKDRKELIYLIPCIIFSHDDIEFVRGTPESKRRFFDQTMTLYDPLFLEDIRKYRHILKQRNAAIREKNNSLLPIYDIQLSSIGLQIQNERNRIVKEFNTIFPNLYNTVSNTQSDIFMKYSPSWKNCNTQEDILRVLKNNRERDERFLTTTSGPHRDRFYVMENKRDFVLTASTGQTRLISLIMKSAQAAFYIKKTGKKPVLLLDDVLLELDLSKRERFLNQIQDHSQAFFTFLPDEHYFNEEEKKGLYYIVEEGNYIISEKSI